MRLGGSGMTEAELERLRKWEEKLVTEWKIPLPPEGWQERLRKRDEAGETRYGPTNCANLTEP